MPFFSIIIPVYNSEKYLEKSLDSAVNQNFNDFEIIIINDNSKDGSEKIIKEYLDIYPHLIRYIKKEEKNTRGPSEVRNLGVKKAVGKYFLYLDSDDYIDKDLLLNLYEEVKNEDIDLVKFKAVRLDEKYNELEKVCGEVFENITGSEAFNKLCFTDKMLDSPTVYLYRKEFFNFNNFEFEENYFHEDFGIIPFIILKAESVISLDYYGYFYVQSRNSITRETDREKQLKKAEDIIHHYDNMIIKLEICELDKETEENVKLYYTNAVVLSIEKLCREDRKIIIEKIKERKLYKNIKAKNIKQTIKRMLIRININMYLKIR